jgi:hypothetical protein
LNDHLPVEQSTKIELVINLDGQDVRVHHPSTVLACADDVIE